MSIVYVRQPHTEAVNMDGDCIIMHVSKQSITRLNEQGSYIWSLLASPQSIESLAGLLQTVYDTTIEQAGKDVSLFLQELIEYDLVMVREEAELTYDLNDTKCILKADIY
ncbi:PqqD family protein [Paenibacillus chitinolyticus]|uniref:PqqD family protein n=1 Tax=Paenibacillus TaxID=44249 RepID=UPI001C438769|nr:PqqD family protein [Paenibacillus chitinolyticus]MBV6713466.1 PqqD family protein [Paenibacillus chitinolyticus]